jgi:hypothetical protein
MSFASHIGVHTWRTGNWRDHDSGKKNISTDYESQLPHFEMANLLVIGQITQWLEALPAIMALVGGGGCLRSLSRDAGDFCGAWTDAHTDCTATSAGSEHHGRPYEARGPTGTGTPFHTLHNHAACLQIHAPLLRDGQDQSWWCRPSRIPWKRRWRVRRHAQPSHADLRQSGPWRTLRSRRSACWVGHQSADAVHDGACCFVGRRWHHISDTRLQQCFWNHWEIRWHYITLQDSTIIST